MVSETKRALITGITGQDGSYLAELLLSKGYQAHGLNRRASTFNTHRIDHLYQNPHDPDRRLFLHYGDLADGTRLPTLLGTIEPHEIYNLAAQSHVRVSLDEPVFTGDVTGLAGTGGAEDDHESPRRGETFVTRKITRAGARIAAGVQDELWLGNLDAARDWGYAKEYVEAMWLMVDADVALLKAGS